MKVFCRVCCYETIEAEIPDEFRRLAIPHPWEDKTLTNDFIENCVKAVEGVTGLPMDDCVDAEAYITAVWSAENGETILEL